jgi:two-component system chemotaxis response regulator CheB
MANAPIRVLIVDDSAIVCGVLKKILNADPEIEVIGSAADPYDAREKIIAMHPDVITLDVEMPRMDGITFLSKLMEHFPVPVVMCSSLTRDGADLTFKAMEFGAVEIVAKPSSTKGEDLRDISIELVDKVKAAARAHVHKKKVVPKPAMTDAKGRPLGILAPGGIGRVRGVGYESASVIKAPPELKRNQHKVIAIGASTGGTEALRVVLERLPRETPGILIVQHMPEYFTLAFANRLNSMCEIEVKEAEPGDEIRPGRALLAPGDSHLMLSRNGVKMIADVRKGPLVCRHRPSVEVLFQSMAKVAGPNAVGVILTGMGGDGSQAMAVMKNAGATNIAQDEASCVVYGMPKEAVKCGGVDRVEHLENIAQAIIDACCKR